MWGGRVWICSGTLAALILAAFLRAGSQTPRRVCELPMAVAGCWTVPVTAETAVFDLALDPGQPCELIVSSLGNATSTFTVTLETTDSTHTASALQPVRWPPTKTTSSRLHPCANTGNEVCPPCATCSLCPGAQRRRLFLHVAKTPLEDPRGYVPVEGRLVREGQAVRVFLDAVISVDDLTPGLVDEIVRLLDEEIVPRSRELLGGVVDIDGDGKLAILLTPWLGKLRSGQVSINGCVRAGDFQRGVDAPFGNSADVVYLNSSLAPGPALKTVLAHEYTHAVCFSQRFSRDEGTLTLEEDWLNEAISHVAENLHNSDWSNLEDRIAAFLESPGSSPLVVTDYYRAGLWRDPGCRGATYLFLRFCVNRFGPELLKQLVRSPQTGCRNLEHATGISFAELFRQWTIALAKDEILPASFRTQAGSHRLEGLVRVEWQVDREPCSIALRGATTTTVTLYGAGIRRIRIRGSTGSRIQITVLRMPLRFEIADVSQSASRQAKGFRLKF